MPLLRANLDRSVPVPDNIDLCCHYVMILVTPKSEVMQMGTKKMGRPTDSPKDISLKAYLDKETAEKLNDCVQALKVSKAEVMRRGVHRVHDGLKK